MVSMWEDTTPGSTIVAIGLMVRLLASLEGQALHELGQMLRSPHRQGGWATFCQALETIERRYHDPGFGVTKMADELHLSRSLLHKVFREAVGTGPQAYLCRYRVDRAQDMILMGEHLMKEVADQTGFADVYSFSRAFKRIVGSSPMGYLEQSRRSRSS
jgi:AraC-like DNA-binding protein